jgi:hypothetical protein
VTGQKATLIKTKVDVSEIAADTVQCCELRESGNVGAISRQENDA